MKILVLHTAFIGDIVLTTPLIRKIKDIYPESKIIYVTTPAGAQILKNNPNLNEVIAYDKKGVHKGIKGIFELGRRLRLENFNLVITPHRYFRSSILTWLTRAPIRKCYSNTTGSFLYTEKIKYDKEKHEVERLLSFLPNNPIKKDIDYEIDIYPGLEEKNKLDEILKKYSNKKIVTIAPGSKWFTKKWPLEYFNRVIEKLEENSEIVQIIIGGQEEKLLNVKLGKNVLDLRGKTSLLDLGEILKRSEIVLTNDSSPVHIASAFKNCWILGIFGPTVKRFGFFPWSKNSEILEVENLDCRPCSIHGGNKCPKGHFKCMLEITPEIVQEKIKKRLKKD
ncbi:MAG: glycosyltransferase family 9 protein [Fusobacteriaceae bacterium]